MFLPQKIDHVGIQTCFFPVRHCFSVLEFSKHLFDKPRGIEFNCKLRKRSIGKQPNPKNLFWDFQNTCCAYIRSKLKDHLCVWILKPWMSDAFVYSTKIGDRYFKYFETRFGPNSRKVRYVLEIVRKERGCCLLPLSSPSVSKVKGCFSALENKAHT